MPNTGRKKVSISKPITVKLDQKRYKELQTNAQTLKLLLATDAAALSVASVAIIGRRDIDNRITSYIELGHSHYKKGKTDVWSKKNELGAWSSTSRTSKGRPWMLSRYSWEKDEKPGAWKTKGTIKAEYTNTLANLHSLTTKAYTATSPAFEAGGRMMKIAKGNVRKGKPGIWAMAENELESSVIPALERTERKLLKDVVL